MVTFDLSQSQKRWLILLLCIVFGRSWQEKTGIRWCMTVSWRMVVRPLLEWWSAFTSSSSSSVETVSYWPHPHSHIMFTQSKSHIIRVVWVKKLRLRDKDPVDVWYLSTPRWVSHVGQCCLLKSHDQTSCWTSSWLSLLTTWQMLRASTQHRGRRKRPRRGGTVQGTV